MGDGTKFHYFNQMCNCNTIYITTTTFFIFVPLREINNTTKYKIY